MESIVLLAVVGILSTIVLGALATIETYRPYALAVLAASGFAALAVQEQAIGSERNLIGAWPIYFFVMFCVQAVAAPIAIIAFVVRRNQHSQRPNTPQGSTNQPEGTSTPQATHAIPPLTTFPKAASKAERLRLVATLNTLCSSLAKAISGLPNADASKGEFSNAASDLFCQARLLSSAHLDDLATHVERVLVQWQRDSPDIHGAKRLLSALNEEIAKLE